MFKSYGEDRHEAEAEGVWGVRSAKGSIIVGRNKCMDSEHFDLLLSQMLNLLRVVTMFTLNRSALYCFSLHCF